MITRLATCHRLFLGALEEGRRNEIAAIDERADAHHRLQRRDRHAVAEGDGDGVQFAPVPRHDRRGALRQFGAQPVELPHLAQERLVPFDALRQRDARRADVGGEGEDLLHVEEAALRLVVVDRKFSIVQRPARIPQRVETVFAGIERHRERERLEGRAHLVDAGGQAVDAVGVVRFLRIVRIEIRHRDHRHHLAGLDVGDETGGRLGVKFLLGLEQFVAQRVLDPQVDRQFDRTLQAVGGKAGAMQIGKAVVVEPLLHPGDALVVDVDEADQMRDLVAGRIDALVLAQEADAGNAEAVDFLLLLRRDFALEPDEPLARRQALAHLDGRRDPARSPSEARSPRPCR